MAKRHYHFGVVGSSPLAALLAGLLRSEHEREVCLITDAVAPTRLPRGIDLSADLMTRPESWRMLRDGRAEALRLLTRIAGRRAIERIDLRIEAHRPEALNAAHHMRHVAAGYGVAMDPLENDATGGAWLVRDVAHIDRPQFRTGLTSWHDDMKLDRFDIGSIDLKRAKDGHGSFSYDGDNVEIAQLVLAEDDAILAVAERREVKTFFNIQQTTTVLTEPAERLRQHVLLCGDDGAITHQRPNGTINSLLPVSLGGAVALAGKRLGLSQPVRAAGLSEFSALRAKDGALGVGVLPRSGTFVVAGAGPIRAFLAPALARFIAGEASADEAAYFTAREPSKKPRPAVAEFAFSAETGEPA